MLTLLGLLGGGTWGGFLAKRRGGNAKDITQYAIGYGIAWGLIALVVSIVIARIG